MRRFLHAVLYVASGSADRDRRRRMELSRLVDEMAPDLLREAACRIRRYYLTRPPSGSPEYDRGYGDAVLDVTRVLELGPQVPRQRSSQPSSSTK
jgi:hypothetical protein